MQFEALKVFCDVVRLEGFSKAAEANDLTQSAVSQIVRQLEDRLGVRLLERRPLQLTDDGQSFYTGCKPIIEQYQELEASIRHTAVRRAFSVRVAAIYSVGLSDMGQFVDRFKTLQPNAEVAVEYLHPDKVYEKVLRGAADFGLVSFPRRMRELTATQWRAEEMVLACSPRHRLARNLLVRPEELEGERYVGFDRGLVIRREVARFLREQGVTVEVALEFDNIENIKQAVESELGIALLPEPTLRREVKDHSLVALPLHGCRFVRPLGIIQRRHHRLSSTTVQFLNLLRETEVAGAAADARADKPANGAQRHPRGDHKLRAVNGAPKDKIKSVQ
jgi:DNA-binding transcriptional LysR family regulator